jgi:hypothetical protein
VSLQRTQTELALSTTGEPDGASAESKVDKESDGMGDHTSIDVEKQKSFHVAPALPEMQACTELSALGVNDALEEQGGDNLISEISLGGNKNNKKNKVYVAPIEEDEFHEA